MPNRIDPKDPAQLKRIDDNLQVIRDKIEEAERVSGQTRSEFLERLDLREPKKKLVEVEIEEKPDKEVSISLKKKKVKIDLKDPLGLNKIVRRKTFQLLTNRLNGKTLLG